MSIHLPGWFYYYDAGIMRVVDIDKSRGTKIYVSQILINNNSYLDVYTNKSSRGNWRYYTPELVKVPPEELARLL